MISQRQYASRRRDLMAMMQGNSIAVIAAAPEKIRSKDTHYPYKQSTNLAISPASLSHNPLCY